MSELKAGMLVKFPELAYSRDCNSEAKAITTAIDQEHMIPFSLLRRALKPSPSDMRDRGQPYPRKLRASFRASHRRKKRR